VFSGATHESGGGPALPRRYVEAATQNKTTGFRLPVFICYGL